MNILKILISILILDFILTLLIFSNFNFADKFYPNLDHRISNKFFHHSFKKNVETIDFWGPLKYQFFTNSLGFKDKSIRKINIKTNVNKRIIMIGDSFTEGIGFKYEETFVGLLDEKYKNKNIEILNAGVASQSPKIYYKKIKYLIEEENLEFDEILVFLDISDIPDEYYYNINFSSNDEENFKLRNYLQNFLLDNSSIYLFFDFLFYKLEQYKKYLIDRFNASKEFNLGFYNTDEYYINLYKALNVDRGKWTSDQKYWEMYGEKGRDLSLKYLNQLLKICNKYNIKFTLAIYPWPYQIFYDYDKNLHRKFWQNWAVNNKIQLIDMFKYFENDNSEKIIKKYFFPGDIHWNKNGHQLISDIISNEYF